MTTIHTITGHDTMTDQNKHLDNAKTDASRFHDYIHYYKKKFHTLYENLMKDPENITDNQKSDLEHLSYLATPDEQDVLKHHHIAVQKSLIDTDIFYKSTESLHKIIEYGFDKNFYMEKAKKENKGFKTVLTLSIINLSFVFIINTLYIFNIIALKHNSLIKACDLSGCFIMVFLLFKLMYLTANKSEESFPFFHKNIEKIFLNTHQKEFQKLLHLYEQTQFTKSYTLSYAPEKHTTNLIETPKTDIHAHEQLG